MRACEHEIPREFALTLNVVVLRGMLSSYDPINVI
jgi:hypothetical protein